MLSKLDYCNSLLIKIPKTQEKCLNKIINHTCRIIFKHSSYSTEKTYIFNLLNTDPCKNYNNNKYYVEY